IVAPHVGGTGPSFGKFLVVWACSMCMNLTILGAALIIFPLLAGAAPVESAPDVQTTTDVEPSSKEYDLTTTDIGDGEGGPLTYDNTRIEEVSVPGAVDPTAAVGIVGAPEAAPMNVPPPPGAGYGTGAAQLDPNQSGTGSGVGSVGGMGGL